MKRKLIDLAPGCVGFISSYKPPYAVGDTVPTRHALQILSGSSVDDGAFTPAQDIFLNKDATKALYHALKACFEPEEDTTHETQG